MLNLINKIITVIFTLIIMINYCNGDHLNLISLSNEDNFTKKNINNCLDFNEDSSQYLVNTFQYFVDKDKNYYRIAYHEYSIHDQIKSLPVELYNINNSKVLGFFKGCLHSIIYFEIPNKKRQFELKDIHFLMPVDKFVQPPELQNAHKIRIVKTCEEFNTQVMQVNNTGFLIYKDNLSGTFHRMCMQTGCAINYYTYSLKPKFEQDSETFMDFLAGFETFGFYWSEKSNPEDMSKMIYQECFGEKLKFSRKIDGIHQNYESLILSNLTFYNIQNYTLDLGDIRFDLKEKLNTCEEFTSYLKEPMNILNGYIYFSDLTPDTQPKHYAMKANPYGPYDLKEKPYLLMYRQINSNDTVYAPGLDPLLFFGCRTRGKKSKAMSDSLVFKEDDIQPHKKTVIRLDTLNFYTPHSKSESAMVSRPTILYTI